MGFIASLWAATPLWMIVIAVLLIFFLLLIRTTNQVYVLYLIKNNFFTFFLAIFFVIFAISVVRIHSTYDVDLTSAEGVGKIIKIYFNWFVGFVKNIAKVTGYAIEQEWISNATSGANVK